MKKTFTSELTPISTFYPRSVFNHNEAKFKVVCYSFHFSWNLAFNSYLVGKLVPGTLFLHYLFQIWGPSYLIRLKKHPSCVFTLFQQLRDTAFLPWRSEEHRVGNCLNGPGSFSHNVTFQLCLCFFHSCFLFLKNKQFIYKREVFDKFMGNMCYGKMRQGFPHFCTKN